MMLLLPALSAAILLGAVYQCSRTWQATDVLLHDAFRCLTGTHRPRTHASTACVVCCLHAAVYQSPRTWQAIDALLPATCPEALLVRVMLIRAAYGGMEGDKDMLLRFSGLWLARFSGTAQPPPELPQQQQQQQQGAGHMQQQTRQQQQQQEQKSPQQQQQQQQAGVSAGLPGRKGPADFEGAAAAGSPWLTFLRAAFQVGPCTARMTDMGLFHRVGKCCCGHQMQHLCITSGNRHSFGPAICLALSPSGTLRRRRHEPNIGALACAGVGY
jgi:hypothetical protein